MSGLLQGDDEIRRVFTDWFENVAPKTLLNNERNGQLLGDYAINRRGMVSIGILNDAVAALGSQLEFAPEPKQLTQEERAAIFQKKEFARIQREQIENSKPFSERRAAAEKAALDAKAETQRQAAAWKERDRLIDNYSINSGPGRIDHARSEYFKGQLRGIKANRPDGSMDWVVVLQTVQEALRKMP
jgi:hypothetical protein